MIFYNIGYLRHFETQIKFFAMVDKKERKSSASPYFSLWSIGRVGWWLKHLFHDYILLFGPYVTNWVDA